MKVSDLRGYKHEPGEGKSACPECNLNTRWLKVDDSTMILHCCENCHEVFITEERQLTPEEDALQKVTGQNIKDVRHIIGRLEQRGFIITNRPFHKAPEGKSMACEDCGTDELVFHVIKNEKAKWLCRACSEKECTHCKETEGDIREYRYPHDDMAHLLCHGCKDQHYRRMVEVEQPRQMNPCYECESDTKDRRHYRCPEVGVTVPLCLLCKSKDQYREWHEYD